MTLRVVGTPGPLHDLLAADAGSGLVILALPASAGPLGALTTDGLSELVDAALTPAFRALREHAAGRVAVVCPACAILPDHRDGARSVVGAGVAMLAELASARPGTTVNVIAVADNVPQSEVVATVRFALSDAAPSLNGAIIRLDGGRDAALTADTRAEGD